MIEFEARCKCGNRFHVVGDSELDEATCPVCSRCTQELVEIGPARYIGRDVDR